MAEFEELMERLLRQKMAAEAVVTRLSTAIEYLKQAKEALGPEDLAKLLESVPLAGEAKKESQKPSDALPPEKVAEAVRAILLEVGRPMKRGLLVKLLQERNVALAGADKNKNLGTILWRHSDKFVNLDKLGYWLKDMPYKDVYDPKED